MTKKIKTPKSGETFFVPLDKLKKSPKNARKVPHPKADIEALAASIAANGVLQNLVVEPERDAKERPTGFYLVTIGEGRRLAQLLRAKRREIRKNELVRCVLDDGANAVQISLAENVHRTPMHPADQYEAFAALHNEQGLSAEDIGARFGVSAAVVRQRLKLGAVSPKLIKLYRKGDLNLDQLTAFTITDDHRKQERVWKELAHKSRAAILRALSEGQVSSDDRRALFVGAKAYREAGGVIVRDLFDEDGGGYFTDAELLNRMVREKLNAVAVSVIREGWKWVVVEPEFDYDRASSMRRVWPEPNRLSDEDQAKLDALEAQYTELSESEGEEDVSEAMARLEAEIAALRGEEVFQPEEIAVAGAFVSLGNDGEPSVERGYPRPEDAQRADAAEGEDGGEGEAQAEAENGKPLSEKLVAELTAHRTAALRHALAQNADIALIATTHALAAATFFPYARSASCLEITRRSASLSMHAAEIDETPAARALAERHEEWARRMPDEPEGLWDFVSGLADSKQLLSLLAHCTALSLNAVRVGKTRNELGDANADALAKALGLDMAACWQPTAANYLSRVSKERILEAVREGVSKEAADNIASLKKAAMVEAAEQRLAGKGWLPAVLRHEPSDAAVPEEREAA